jgi:hypothetical protein
MHSAGTNTTVGETPKKYSSGFKLKGLSKFFYNKLFLFRRPSSAPSESDQEMNGKLYESSVNDPAKRKSNRGSSGTGHQRPPLTPSVSDSRMLSPSGSKKNVLINSSTRKVQVKSTGENVINGSDYAGYSKGPKPASKVLGVQNNRVSVADSYDMQQQQLQEQQLQLQQQFRGGGAGRNSNSSIAVSSSLSSNSRYSNGSLTPQTESFSYENPLSSPTKKSDYTTTSQGYGNGYGSKLSTQSTASRDSGSGNGAGSSSGTTGSSIAARAGATLLNQLRFGSGANISGTGASAGNSSSGGSSSIIDRAGSARSIVVKPASSSGCATDGHQTSGGSSTNPSTAKVPGSRSKHSSSSSSTANQPCEQQTEGEEATAGATTGKTGATAAASGVAGGGGKPLCCDKCDGKHLTDNCPHYKKSRENHPDAQKGAKRIGGVSTLPGSSIYSARVVRQPGDGSCLFHSMSYGLPVKSNATRLRAEICAFIQQNPHLKICDTPLSDWVKWDSGATVAEYARHMSRGSWGGGIEMACVSQVRRAAAQ